HIAVEFKQKRYKIIQEATRTWLNMYVDAYESEIQEYEHQYQQALNEFELNHLNHVQHINGITLFNSFINYINHRTNRIKQEIYYDKIPVYRRQLLRLHRRLDSSTKMVPVSLKVIIVLIYYPCTATQLAYLSRGG
ncbi:unnamed protein product, partial [Rotaria sp. Silwood2]